MVEHYFVGRTDLNYMCVVRMSVMDYTLRIIHYSLYSYIILTLKNERHLSGYKQMIYAVFRMLIKACVKKNRRIFHTDKQKWGENNREKNEEKHIKCC